jgi:hypothetical protein
LKSPIWAVKPVVASTVEIFDEHLCFTNKKGELAALFLLDRYRAGMSVWTDPSAAFSVIDERSELLTAIADYSVLDGG